MTKQTSYQALTEALEHQGKLKQKLTDVNSNVHHLSIEINRSRSNLIEFRAAVESWQSSYQRTQYESDKQNLEVAQEILKKGQTKLDKDIELFEDSKTEVSALKDELYGLSIECDLSEILEHQKAIDDEKLETIKYQDLITNQQQIITTASLKTDRLAPLMQQREELLVNIALGNDRNDELEQLDTDIENLQAEESANASSNKKIIAHANQTVAGLQKRLTVIQDRLKTLNNLTPRIIDQFLVGRAEAVAHDYQQTAAELINQLTKLTVLDSLINEIGQQANSSVFPKEWWNLLIPKLNIMSPDKALNGDKNHFVNIRSERPPAIESVEAMKLELIEQGLHWPE